MFEVGIVNGEGQWVILMGDFPARQAAELWRMRSYLRGNPANMEIRGPEDNPKYHNELASGPRMT